jgi:branched-chain amino acid transport system ATP-binding protein
MSDREHHTGPKSLKVENLHARYGDSKILHGVAFVINEGEVVSLLGRNGAGKTTTLRSIMGLIPDRTGSITFKHAELIDKEPEDMADLGIGYCPDDRGIFASLTVEENLFLPPVVQPGGMHLDDIFDLFPNIKERLSAPGNKLSGGEQQMLAIARILRTGAKLLLLDEPTEGLAPLLVRQIGRVLRQLKTQGYTVLLIEQNFNFASTISDWHYLVENGRVVDSISNDEARQNTTSTWVSNLFLLKPWGLQ